MTSKEGLEGRRSRELSSWATTRWQCRYRLGPRGEQKALLHNTIVLIDELTDCPSDSDWVQRMREGAQRWGNVAADKSLGGVVICNKTGDPRVQNDGLLARPRNGSERSARLTLKKRLNIPDLFSGTGTLVLSRLHTLCLFVRANGFTKEMDRDLLPGRGKEGAR
jgi:hypothetical protein